MTCIHSFRHIHSYPRSEGYCWTAKNPQPDRVLPWQQSDWPPILTVARIEILCSEQQTSGVIHAVKSPSAGILKEIASGKNVLATLQCPNKGKNNSNNNNNNCNNINSQLWTLYKLLVGGNSLTESKHQGLIHCRSLTVGTALALATW